MSPEASKFVAFVAIASLALLLSANVLLWRVVQDDDKGPAATQASAPALPAPTKAGTSRALLRELDKTSRRFGKPLDEVLNNLDGLTASAASLDQLTLQLGELNASAAQLGDAGPAMRDAAKRIKSMSRQFKTLSNFLTGLGPVLVDIEKSLTEMTDDLDRIRVCTEKPSSCN